MIHMIRQKFSAVLQFFSVVRAWSSSSLRILQNLFIRGGYGYLSWYMVFFLAIKNLKTAASRTTVTAFAIAAGTAAIVFLVGFAYGLQQIVTNRLLQPNSLRLTDVQASSTAVALDPTLLQKIQETTGVERVAPAMSLAGIFRLGESRTEVVVVAARNDFLDFSGIKLVQGEWFSQEAESSDTQENASEQLVDLVTKAAQGEVAGVSTQSAEPVVGEFISDKIRYFRVPDEVYIPVRTAPTQHAEIMGYIRGSVLEKYAGKQVWGGQYQASSASGKAYQLSTGEWLGRWLSLTQPAALFQEVLPTVYRPVTNEHGAQKTTLGFVSEAEILILTDQEVRTDTILDNLRESMGSVLGDATPSAQEQAYAAVTTEDSSATIAAELAAIVSTQQQTDIVSPNTTAYLNVAKQGGKEVIVSAGLLKTLGFTDVAQALGTTVSLEYIISGGLVPGYGGKIISEQAEYTIIGITTDESQQLVFAPLSDLESMGVSKYSVAKVLVASTDQLQPVRDRIETLGLSTSSISDTLQQVNRLFTVMRFLLGSFGLIAFVVALFGMFNTLTVSLLERTREIGVMKTLGTTDTDIIKLLFAESTTIGIVGGAAGIFLGVFFGKALDLLLLFFRRDTSLLLFSFPWKFLFGVFLFTVLVGFFTGLYPVRRAQKIEALNALRYE